MRDLAIYLERRPIHFVVLLTVAIALYILSMRRDKSEPLRVFVYYLSTSLLINFITDYYSAHRWNNILYNNIWVLGSTLLLAAFFYNIFLDDKRKQFIVYIAGLYCMVFMVNFITINPSLDVLHDHKFVSWALPLRSLAVLLFCGMFYQELLSESYIKHIERSSVFWIVSLTMIYYCSCLFTTIVYSQEYTWTSKQQFRFIAEIPLYFEILIYIGIAAALLYENHHNKKDMAAFKLEEERRIEELIQKYQGINYLLNELQSIDKIRDSEWDNPYQKQLKKMEEIAGFVDKCIYEEKFGGYTKE